MEAKEEVHQLDPEQQAQIEQEWRSELAKVEDEINTLKQVLANKQQEAAKLKRKLGISAWNEFTTGALNGVANLKESAAFGVATESLKGVGEKTSSILGGIRQQTSSKLAKVKESPMFKSFGETFDSVKNKVTGSPSTSSFDDAINNIEQERAQQQKQEVAK